MVVVKRDGRIKTFDTERIHTAIKKAYVDIYSNDNKFKDDYNFIEPMILKTINSLNTTELYIEELQDIILNVLNRIDVQVCNSYREYRNQRSNVRESKMNLISEINGLIDYTNTEVLTENSNKQSQLASTQRDLISGEVSKYISKSSLIPQHLLEAHEKGIIKIHDLDYFLQPIYNCELVNLEDMLQNGTVINKKMIEKPKSLRTAMTLATQIAAQVASVTYGGQTMSLSHLAPFVRISHEKIKSKYMAMNLPITQNKLEELIDSELSDEIKDSVQTFNYQISTLMTTNGQSPFISVCMYLNENPEYIKETAMLVEEFLNQRIGGMKNEYGVIATQTFPKLLYFLDENNTYEGSEYFYLTKLAVKSTSTRMNPDYISAKKMKELTGHVFPCMGCRAFLSPFQDKQGNDIFYGRGNLGVCTINLPYIALASKGNTSEFWRLLDKNLELCRQVGELRFNKLKGIKASVAPILWQHGAISRLQPDDDITKAIIERGFTVTLGYSGIYETVKYLTGLSHTTEEGFALAEEIMKHLKSKCESWKVQQPHLRFALYGTPQESTGGRFNDKLIQQFGIIEDVTSKGFVTNSYHVDVREEIDAFTKLKVESELQKYSTGGAVSYCETFNMEKNQEALLHLIQYMYETIMYSEINFESDVCGICKYTGVMDNDSETLDWVCPQCGNRDQNKLSVVRRTCGYLSETIWTKGRKLDILNRVKHI